MIEVRNLRKEYVMGVEHVIALDRINLDIARGQICCIYGESGSGKSTLLNQLAGMERPTRGGVRIGGIVVSRLDERELAEFRQKRIGFVFPSFNLLTGLSGVANVGQTIVLVTHDEHMAAYADRIVTLLDGRIVHDTEQDE